LRFLDHTQTQTHSVTLVRTSDQLVAVAVMFTKQNQRQEIICTYRDSTHTIPRRIAKDLHLKPVSYRDRRSHIALCDCFCADALT